MKPGCRLIKNEKNFTSSLAFSQKRGKLYPLCFTTGKCIGRLPELYITQTYFAQGFDGRKHGFLVLKKRNGIIYTHFQNVKYIFTMVLYFQHFFFKPFAATYFAGQMHIRQELHLHNFFTLTFTGIAAAGIYVKR